MVCSEIDATGATDLADRLRHVLSEPFQVDAVAITIGASVGTALSGPGSTVDSLLRTADARMYADKARRRGEDRRGGEREHRGRPGGCPLSPEALWAEGREQDPAMSVRLMSADHRRAVVEALGVGLLVQDTAGGLLYANSRADALLHQQLGSALRDGRNIVDHRRRPMEREALPGRRALRSGAPVLGVVGLREPDGLVHWLEVDSRPLSASGEAAPYAVVSTLRDVTRQRSADESLELKARLLNSVGQAVIAWDTDSSITYLNQAAEDLYGWAQDEAVGKHVGAVAPPSMSDLQLDDLLASMAAGRLWEGELSIVRRDGTIVAVQLTNTPVLDDGELVGHIGISSDISERRAAEAILAHQAGHDALTGLPNRSGVAAMVEEAWESATARAADVAVVALDVGSLEVINDAFGLAVGDEVIRRCADELGSAVHPGDGVARLSDQCFAVCCGHVADLGGVEAFAEGLRVLLAQSFKVGGIDVRLQVAAGVAVGSVPDEPASELFRRADIARSWARRGASTCVYDRTMGEELLRQVELAAVVERSIESATIELFYQPILRLGDQRTVGAEALLRLVGADGAPLSQLDVVDAAERSGRIGRLGELVLRTACRDAARWQRSSPGQAVPVSVNVSARQLDDPDLVDQVASALADAGLHPSLLCLEITESALMGDPIRSTAVLSDLKALGVRLSADDFGTGYSSLSYLKSFPLDELKVDQSFVAGIPQVAADLAITRAIVAVADALGLSVVAEGIESDAQLAGVRDLGCTHGQGWLWSKAVPTDDLVARLGSEAVAQR